MITKTMIRVSQETSNRLKKLGTLGDTYDSVINRACKLLERHIHGDDKS